MITKIQFEGSKYQKPIDKPIIHYSFKFNLLDDNGNISKPYSVNYGITEYLFGKWKTQYGIDGELSYSNLQKILLQFLKCDLIDLIKKSGYEKSKLDIFSEKILNESEIHDYRFNFTGFDNLPLVENAIFEV